MRKVAWVSGMAALGLVALVVGCGGSGGGNNDQGVVFRADGIFRGQESIQSDMITCEVPNTDSQIVDASFTLSLSLVPDFPNRTNAFADPCGGYLKVENLLDGIGLNVQQVIVRYEIPGAAVEPQPHPISVGQRLEPASSVVTDANIAFIELVGQIVPATVIVFLNQNVNRLPGTPYIMKAFLSAQGQSDAGTNYETNEVGYQFTITP
jgi:hypothetical protein